MGETAGAVASPSLLPTGTKAGAGVGVCPVTGQHGPGYVESGAVWVYTPSQNISPKVKHLFGRIAVI
jgi:hypothetical protein